MSLLRPALASLFMTSMLLAQGVRIDVYADRLGPRVSRYLTGACIEDVNHEIYGGLYSQMVFGESFQEPVPQKPGDAPTISGMWRKATRGDVKGSYSIVTDRPFIGKQSQRMSFESGAGEWGVENQGLNRWGMNFVAGKPYEGYIWVRLEKTLEVFVALENRDGTRVYAERGVAPIGLGWQRLDFALTPNASDANGRFVLKLKQSGAVVLGHAFLQPGQWGRFEDLPVRRDVAEGMIEQGITVLRYGGSMVNNAGYRWKNMIGPRDRRPPYAGTWYKYSTNGWGILDFMDFCEAAGFEYIPAFNMDETPQDMADFVEYAKGSRETEWGRKRMASGHRGPYELHYIQLGNEERVDEAYFAKFKALAEVIWAKDPNVVLVVGDFVYSKRIRDPFHFEGAASKITSLAAQQKILHLAKQHNREVWFDLHVNTAQPSPADGSLEGMFSFADALAKIADGARHKVAVFEFNAHNHAQKRALANALAINAIERDGRLPVVTSANGLQPDGQNDNGWDQGLLFLNPSKVWLQAPGYVTQMLSRNYLPQLVRCEVSGGNGKLDANAKRSMDGKKLTLQVVNPGEEAVAARIKLGGFTPRQPQAQVIELTGPMEALNTAQNPSVIVPKQSQWNHRVGAAGSNYTFPANSFTLIRFE
ncbi:MAG: alpha-L-arabinofuranosidase C-terminal domain-containing protein [Bryobacteraceae bacterium]